MKRIITILTIVCLIALTGCVELNYVTGSKKDNTKCQEWVLSEIPKEYDMYEFKGKETAIDFGVDWWCEKNSKCLNYYVKGSEAGQNINYYYLDGMVEHYFKMSETITADRGLIKGTREVKYKPVIKPIEGTEDSYYLKNEGSTHRSQRFQLVTVEIVSCNWVE